MPIGHLMDQPVSLLFLVEFGWKSSKIRNAGCSDPKEYSLTNVTRTNLTRDDAQRMQGQPGGLVERQRKTVRPGNCLRPS